MNKFMNYYKTLNMNYESGVAYSLIHCTDLAVTYVNTPPLILLLYLFGHISFLKLFNTSLQFLQSTLFPPSSTTLYMCQLRVLLGTIGMAYFSVSLKFLVPHYLSDLIKTKSPDFLH
jgi:hypothetical protein